MTGLAAGVTALMCLLTLWPVQAQAAELPIQSRAALLMEKPRGRCCMPGTSTSSWSPPASPRS